MVRRGICLVARALSMMWKDDHDCIEVVSAEKAASLAEIHSSNDYNPVERKHSTQDVGLLIEIKQKIRKRIQNIENLIRNTGIWTSYGWKVTPQL